ncbi:MAG: hypothetical protein J6P66_08260 [Bacteroidaceae bacterium]|nr:hypothetical protein [Bacteroidaceae bacterium]
MKMRLYLIALLFAITSCSPVVTSNIIHRNQPLESVDQVVLLGEKEPLPADAEWMGSVQVNGRGSYNQMIDLTRNEAWKNGAEYVRIKNYSSQELRSDIHIMNSDVYRSDTVDVLYADTQASGLVQMPAVSGDTGRDSDAYLLLGGEADFAYSAKSSSSSFVLALGVGYFVTPSLSLELGGSYSSTSYVSDPDIKVIGKSLSASLAYHLPLARNLYYVPEFEVDYLNYSADATDFNFMCLALAPLMVEYRADDSMWGFRAGIGEFGMAFPVAGTAAPLKSLYSVNLNSVSLVFVKYF